MVFSAKSYYGLSPWTHWKMWHRQERRWRKTYSLVIWSLCSRKKCFVALSHCKKGNVCSLNWFSEPQCHFAKLKEDKWKNLSYKPCPRCQNVPLWKATPLAFLKNNRKCNCKLSWLLPSTKWNGIFKVWALVKNF